MEADTAENNRSADRSFPHRMLVPEQRGCRVAHQDLCLPGGLLCTATAVEASEGTLRREASELDAQTSAS